MSENLSQSPQNAQNSQPKSSAKFVVTMTVVGGLIAVSLVSMYFPKMISWYFEPPTPSGSSCAPSIQWAIEKLQRAQLYAVAAGAVVGMVAGFKFRRRS